MATLEEQAKELMEANDGELTDEQMAELLDGEFDAETGDTDGDEPTPDPKEDDQPKEDPKGQEEPAPEPEDKEAGSEDAEEGPEPVLLAKDGKHTIEYQKLVEAREEAKTAKEQAKQWQDIAEGKNKLLEDMKATPPAKEDETEAAEALSEDMQALLEDYPEVATQIKDMMDSNKTLTQKISELEGIVDTTKAETAAERHFSQIRDAHKDYESIFAGDIYKNWKASQPEFIKEGSEQIVKNGTSAQVIELLNVIKKATAGDTADEDKGKPDDTAEKVAEKIKAAEEKAAAPSSLSEIPGSNAHHDEAEAMREMSPTALMDKFEGKTQEQIEAMLEKAL